MKTTILRLVNSVYIRQLDMIIEKTVTGSHIIFYSVVSRILRLIGIN